MTRTFPSALLVSILAFLVFASPASSGASSFDNMYPTPNALWKCVDTHIGGNFCQTDNASLTVWIDPSVTKVGVSHIKSALTDFNATDLNVTFAARPVLTGAAETDLIYQVGALKENFVGETWCDDAASVMKCDQHYVKFKDGTPDLMTACHETGHAVGLTHGDMASPKQPNQSASLGCMVKFFNTARTWLGLRNAQEINSTY